MPAVRFSFGKTYIFFNSVYSSEVPEAIIQLSAEFIELGQLVKGSPQRYLQEIDDHSGDDYLILPSPMSPDNRGF